MIEPRVAPLPFDHWAPEAVAASKGLLLHDGQPLNIFATLARYPALFKRWMVFATHVLAKNSLSPRDRELLILRAGWLCQAPYEWAQHVVIGKASDISDAEIQRITVGPDAPGWSSYDASLLRAADELHHESRISDSTWASLAGTLTEEQMFDVIFTVGQYTLVSYALNSCGVQLEPGLDPSPMPADRA
jgi:4-carboxymuconolactone decarboxylase